ncbi:trap-type c4-dicarboxylate transport system, periplasmic component [hydrocarbon metagenome]|uniref:Trap-type c4-dicarboxylate transport system, periplasmic component n=1 Tax=hydrocarbon metagenome TaxID=938273 RepID=A0A0W8FPH3_9ZZZZ
MLKKIAFLLPALIFALLISGCEQDKNKATTKAGAGVALKLATVTAMDHTYNQGAVRYAELVKERSNGRIEISIHPNGQIASGERELLEAIPKGTVDLYVGSTGPVGGFSPSMGILDLPFIFRDYAHVDKVLDGPIGRQLLDDLDKANLKGLAFWENGFRNLTNSKRIIKLPADAKGLKIRTMENKVHIAAWKAIGVIPVPLSFGVLYGDLQKKTIDGEENPVDVIYSTKFYEVQKYLSLTQHVYSPALIIISPKVWQALSKEDQAMMLKAAQEVAPYQRKLGRDSEEKHIAELAAKGMTVTKDINKKVWYRIMEGAMGEFIQSFGKDKVEAIINTK